MLRDLAIKASYRSDDDDLIQSFYIPCLRESRVYQRAVGFFSSSALSTAARGLNAFLDGGGQMQLIASPHLSKEDVDAIELGYSTREEIEATAVARSLTEVVDRVERERLGMLAWLIAQGRLDIQIAVRNQPLAYGLYHEKLGIFSDGQDFIAFTGSSNESESGLVINFECVDVFCSWKPEDRARSLNKQLAFERLWENQTKGLRIVPFPAAAREQLLVYRPTSKPRYDPEEVLLDVTVTPPGCPRLPADLELRPYQQEVITNWLRNKGRGTFKMATGAGKTITSLAAATRVYEGMQLQCLVIIAPYRHLVTQWAREAQRFGLEPLLCFESRLKWVDQLRSELYRVRSGTSPFLTIITTNATLTSEAFQAAMRYLPSKSMIIGDEAHNLGAPAYRKALPTELPLRIALSATPERWFDEEGTEGIYEYFGPVLQPEFTLADALAVGALVPYYYHPVLVELTDDEAEIYEELSAKIGKLMGQNGKPNPDMKEALDSLLMRRARLIGSAANKVRALKDLMKPRLDTSHTLFYCGTGQSADDSGEVRRHVDLVAAMLGHDLGLRIDVYTAETSLDEREDLSKRFADGDLQGLVAIKCLDEGVDIPATRTAFILASSTNPREFVQRRGRVLRRYPGKESADIYDFIVIPPQHLGLDYNLERNLLRRELSRFVEFADLALNCGEARATLLPLQEKYQLLSF